MSGPLRVVLGPVKEKKPRYVRYGPRSNHVTILYSQERPAKTCICRGGDLALTVANNNATSRMGRTDWQLLCSFSAVDRIDYAEQLKKNLAWAFDGLADRNLSEKEKAAVVVRSLVQWVALAFPDCDLLAFDEEFAHLAEVDDEYLLPQPDPVPPKLKNPSS